MGQLSHVRRWRPTVLKKEIDPLFLNPSPTSSLVLQEKTQNRMPESSLLFEFVINSRYLGRNRQGQSKIGEVAAATTSFSGITANIVGINIGESYIHQQAPCASRELYVRGFDYRVQPSEPPPPVSGALQQGQSTRVGFETMNGVVRGSYSTILEDQKTRLLPQ
ncbi:hypothetical protein CPB83DRAFT_835817 [Crepidotus variabilis]|uniref:Uncharacterized protein n=1 Tax=Crepidotus variabilis TaxID=179855 RepID=A0A9P6EGM1_9AGAR|nr:hypothetical protein CPB83DRAFT_835817 [Crepidotus variabilis]